MITRYHDLWQHQVLRRWKPCDVFHFLSHGAAIQVSRRAKQEGATTIAEAVNSHPLQMMQLITEEYERLGLPYKKGLPTTMQRMLVEQDEADYILAPSRFVADAYLRNGFAKDRLITIPFGVDPGRFRYLGLKKDKFTVLYVAQITPRKAHLDLLEAWRMLRLPKEECELIFVGSMDAVMRPILNRYRDMFTYVGMLNQADLEVYYNRASVFVMPSVEEGCSYAPLEAMSCGLPVILTENTGTGELVEHGKEGYIVPIRNPAKIAAYLELMFNDSEMLQAMSTAALAKATVEFSWKRYANRLHKIYLEL